MAQELTAAGISLWYYYSEEIGEVDFLMEGAGGKTIPIEVKSGRKVRSHAALDGLLAMDAYRIRNAVVLSQNNLSREGQVLYVPLYMTFCLDELVERGGEDFTFAPAAV